MHSVKTNVYLIDVDVGYEEDVPLATKYRRFTVRFQESQILVVT